MRFLVLLMSICFSLSLSAQVEGYDALLQKYVDTEGNVDYKGLKSEEASLDAYIAYLAETAPSADWSREREMAFWINAYNAYTLHTILEHYPIGSITNIKKKGKDAWNIKFAVVGGKAYTLNDIEHKMLREKFNDPRIHVGVNCASYSCPQLANFAFTAENLDASLEKLMKMFVNDTKRNEISAKKVKLSKIFEWYKGDFTQEGKLIDYLNKYADTPINKKAKVRFLEYNWSLNGK